MTHDDLFSTMQFRWTREDLVDPSCSGGWVPVKVSAAKLFGIPVVPYQKTKSLTVGGLVLMAKIDDLFVLPEAQRAARAEGLTNDELLAQPIEEQRELSARARNVLHNLFLKTIGDLAECPRSRLEEAYNCGARTMREIEDFLENIGLSLPRDTA